MIFHGCKSLNSAYPKQAVVMIGNFDGVHLGHRRIVQRAQEIAASSGLPVVAFTFKPHPTIELKPTSDLRLLMTYEEKNLQLEQLGVNFIVEEPFVPDFWSRSADEFFSEVLLGSLHARAIVVGNDFRFGKGRQGNIDDLQDRCAKSGIQLEVVSPLKIDEEVVSSSRIRNLLAAGDIQKAQRLLGRSFFYKGEIIHGDKRGRTMGFPTANMACEQKFPLPIGVYATSVFWKNKIFPSVTNIGRRPTFNADAEIPIRIETHLLGQDFDLYGEILEVRFHERIREERKFSGVQELAMQIRKDCAQAEQFLQTIGLRK